MKYLLILTFTFTCLSITSAHKNDGIRIINKAKKMKVFIDRKAQKALKDFNSDLNILNETHFSKEAKEEYIGMESKVPMAIAADFNTDNRKDYAFIAEDKNSFKILMFINTDKGWKIHEVDSFNKKDYKNTKLNFYLLTTDVDQNIKYDSLLVGRYMGHPEVYQLKNGRIINYLTEKKN